MTLITIEEFKLLAPKAKNLDKWVNGINQVLPTYDITRGKRLAMFIAQCGHESAGFTILQENLNYSVDGLRKIFGKYFPSIEVATQYARQPQRIANRVYANRMSNGSEESGDGWKYRGRGILQITGKANYTALSKAIWSGDEGQLLNDPDLLLSESISLHSAGWYWSRSKLNALCDKDDVVAVTKLINGGTHGIDDRISRYAAAKKVLS